MIYTLFKHAFSRRRHSDDYASRYRGVPRTDPAPQPYEWTPEIAAQLSGLPIPADWANDHNIISKR